MDIFLLWCERIIMIFTLTKPQMTHTNTNTFTQKNNNSDKANFIETNVSHKNFVDLFNLEKPIVSNFVIVLPNRNSMGYLLSMRLKRTTNFYVNSINKITFMNQL